MKRFFILLLIPLFLAVTYPAYAVVDPLAKPNNRIGIHILFKDELQEAAKLVNSNGGDWGYVVIPIQAGDKDLQKWQSFMDECKRLRLIPLIRLATEGDYFNTKVWRKPTDTDIVDFANFLNSLSWPTQNRYVIIFNEVNRGDEWGGSPSPEEYAKLLDFSVTTFKQASPDFFIISSGMDNAAPNKTGLYMNQYTYYAAMQEALPGVFSRIDGLSSHSYPNPGFSQPYTVLTQMSIASFLYERQLIESFTGKKLPVFITETGWTSDKVPDEIRAEYYYQALSSTWNDSGIVTIVPFLLRAGGGPFGQFSFLTADGKETKQYQMLKSYPKIKGTPVTPTPPKVLADRTEVAYVTKNFEEQETDDGISLSEAVQSAFKWIMKL